MNSIQVGNVTIASIFQLILIQQNYRTVHFWSNSLQDESFNNFVQIASGSLNPFRLLNIKSIRKERPYFDEPLLNVLIVSDLSDVKKILNGSSLYETTLIWTKSFIDNVNETQNSWLKISSKVIVLTNSKLYTSNNLVKTKSNEISLTNVSLSLLNRFLKTFFSVTSVNGSNFKIFTEFNAPKSELTRINNNFYLIGPDGIIVESFVKWLNVKPTFSSSVGIKHPNYQDWLNSSTLSPRLRYQHYHPAVLTKNLVTIFDDR